MLDSVAGKNYEAGWKGAFHDGQPNTNVAACVITDELDTGLFGRYAHYGAPRSLMMNLRYDL
ncbi:hypothetical protein [Pseudomonas sp. C9-3]|uniref:hypothetical protein n=1 Tax=Pseudomonas sp. C9-3 TaxID=3078264 RepID=UPI0028E829E6|nr:hypothetical protein [Pseudomonas sp. C9-3]